MHNNKTYSNTSTNTTMTTAPFARSRQQQAPPRQAVSCRWRPGSLPATERRVSLSRRWPSGVAGAAGAYVCSAGMSVLFVSLSLCLSVFSSLCLSASLSLCVSVSLCLCLLVSRCVSLFLFVCLCVCVSLSLSLSISLTHRKSHACIVRIENGYDTHVSSHLSIPMQAIVSITIIIIMFIMFMTMIIVDHYYHCISSTFPFINMFIIISPFHTNAPSLPSSVSGLAALGASVVKLLWGKHLIQHNISYYNLLQYNMLSLSILLSQHIITIIISTAGTSGATRHYPYVHRRRTPHCLASHRAAHENGGALDMARKMIDSVRLAVQRLSTWMKSCNMRYKHKHNHL